MLIKNLIDLSKTDIDIAGGKGASLGEILKAGIPVPRGFVVLAMSFDKFLGETDLNVEIKSLLHKVNKQDANSVDQASNKIRELILHADFPKDIAEEIIKEFSKLKTKYVAVRSSATAEDSSATSWAGELESFLNTTKANLLENVKKCWASLFTPRAIFYRFENNLHNTKVSVAVVIQEMIQSEVSGICFTVHPVTKDRDQMVIEAGYGLGQGQHLFWRRISLCEIRPPIPSKKKSSPSEGVVEGGGWGEELRHARAEAKRFRRLALSQTSKQNNFQFLLRKIWRAGVKKLKENCFALLAEVRRAETRSGAIQAFSVQKRFELRSAIATNQDISNFQRKRFARSPRLRRDSLRKKFCISELNNQFKMT